MADRTELVEANQDYAKADADEHTLGPFSVQRQCERLSQGWPLRARDLPPSGRCDFTVAGPTGSSRCVVDSYLNLAPVEVRRGVTIDVDGRGVSVRKSWLRSVQVVGDNLRWTISRRGFNGWQMTDNERVIAEYRWLQLRIRPDLESRDAALAVAMIETGIPESVSLLRWINNV